MNILSPSLNCLVMQYTFKTAFNLNKLFSENPKIIDKLIKNIIPFLKQPDDIIIQ